MQDTVLNLLTYLEPTVCALALGLLFYRGVVRTYTYLACFLAIRFASTVICLGIMHLSSAGIERHLAYKAYFLTYWSSYALEAVLSLVIIYSLFKIAMRPFPGLQRLGVLVFRWAATITGALAFVMACNSHSSGGDLFRVVVTQLQQTSSILTLCLLLFVCFAIRPMGLNYRSRVFGVSFGLGIMATASLIDSAWITQSPNVHSSLSLANGVATCLTFLTWSLYFAFPEKVQRIIMVPTTSPFLHWNEISEALGDEPGYVAIGGVSPEVFAPAEVEMMFRASAKMAELAAQDNEGEGDSEDEQIQDERSAQSMIA